MVHRREDEHFVPDDAEHGEERHALRDADLLIMLPMSRMSSRYAHHFLK